jgi:four helix bundle protein
MLVAAGRRNICDQSGYVAAAFSESLAFSSGADSASSWGMNSKALELQERTRAFASAVIKFCDGLPQHAAVRSIVDQLLDSAGSTDSNYRATCRARSPDEFIAKIGVAAEEADESKGWLQLLVSSNLATTEQAGPLIQEADELTAIFVASRKTAELNRARRKQLQHEMKRRSRR